MYDGIARTQKEVPKVTYMIRSSKELELLEMLRLAGIPRRPLAVSSIISVFGRRLSSSGELDVTSGSVVAMMY